MDSNRLDAIGFVEGVPVAPAHARHALPDADDRPCLPFRLGREVVQEAGVVVELGGSFALDALGVAV
eukprot:11874634-Heterocapsa_arctica.AAC.1